MGPFAQAVTEGGDFWVLKLYTMPTCSIDAPDTTEKRMGCAVAQNLIRSPDLHDDLVMQRCARNSKLWRDYTP